MKLNISNTTEVLLLATAMSSAHAGSINPPIMDMTKEQVMAICAQDPSWLGLKTTNGTKICEISMDNGNTWILLTAALAAGLSLASVGRYILRTRLRKNSKEEISSEEEELLKSISTSMKKLESRTEPYFESKADDANVSILKEEWAPALIVPADDNIVSNTPSGIRAWRMTAIKIFHEQFMTAKKLGGKTEGPLRFFNAKALLILWDDAHSDEDKDDVLVKGRAVDPNNPMYNNVDGVVVSHQIESIFETSPSWDSETQNVVLDIQNTNEVTMVKPVSHEDWETLARLDSIVTKRDYSVGQKLITREDKMRFISTSLQGDRIRIRKNGTIEKLVDGRWVHKDGAIVAYFETDDVFRANSMTTSKQHFVIDILGDEALKNIESPLIAAPVDLAIDTSSNEHKEVIKDEDIVTSDILAFVLSSTTTSATALQNAFGGTQKGMKKVIQVLVDRCIVEKQGNKYIVLKN